MSRLISLQRNFMGKGQEVNAGVNWSRYSRSVSVGFTEPYLFDKNVLLGGEIYRRDFNSFSNTGNGSRRNTYSSQHRRRPSHGFPVTEFFSAAGRYSIVNDKLSLDEGTFYTDTDGTGPLSPTCDPLKAGRYLCDEIGTRWTSLVGYSLIYDNRNGLRATRGQRVVFSQDFAGLGGDVNVHRSRVDGTKYLRLPKGFLLSIHGEGGYIHPLQSAPPGEGRDAVSAD